MSRVLVSCVQMQRCIDEFRPQLEAAGVVVDLATITGQQLDVADLEPIIGDYDGVIAGDDVFSRSVFERATRLRVVSKWGVGLDSIDRAAAADHGIVVTNTPNMFDEEVGDVTIGYLILLARSLHRIDAAVRAGRWLKVEGRSLGGRTLGVVGLGGIGRATVRRAVAMDMEVLGADPDPEAARLATDHGATVVDLPELFARSHAIALNCPLTPATRGLLGAEALELVQPGVLVVNTARGPVVDEAALIAALRDGRVGGAALDVFEEEPLPSDSPLRTMEQVVLGSHNASNTREAVLRTSAQAVANLLAHLPSEVS